MHITWQDKIPNTEVLQRAEMPSVGELFMKSQLRWTGHVVRMPDDRIPKKIFYGELSEGKRSRGGQRKRYKDSLKATLKQCQIDTESWEEMAEDRTLWRRTIHIVRELA